MQVAISCINPRGYGLNYDDSVGRRSLVARVDVIKFAG
jgi:hypothetical protein